MESSVNLLQIFYMLIRDKLTTSGATPIIVSMNSLTKIVRRVLPFAHMRAVWRFAGGPENYR